jgi:NTP pyrophosphatase (non-canonical NTP hydrolase)
MKLSFSANQSIAEFQKLIEDIYALPDDRMFSIYDILANVERFGMRSLKGIRKNNSQKTTKNLLISFSWICTLANRLHVNLEAAVWNRFPLVCSYCGKSPCVCKKEKIIKRVELVRRSTNIPKTMVEFQKMFAAIYPNHKRTLADSGIHLAEETGEVSESINFFLGKHKSKQFEKITEELADWVSCMFGVANSAKIDVSKELVKMFNNNCHVCHQAPCVCKFEFVYKFRS